MDKIALIAGSGRFPIVFAQAARKNGCKIIAIAINGQTRKEIADYVDKVYWVDIGQIGRMFQILLLERLKKVVLAGKIPKAAIFNRAIEKDDEARSILENTKDRKTGTLLKEAAGRLGKIGIVLMDSTSYLKDHMVKEGVLTKLIPDERTWQDIRFGESAAKEIARLDIGQTVVVKDKDIIAVEGVEGTNETIKRAGSLVGPGIIVVKVARPDQDMRFDVPIIGAETVEVLNEVRAKALAIEAERTLIIDPEDVITRADKAGLAIAAV